jgi:photosystem II stability/assembly factor-like uncharacterized protein
VDVADPQRRTLLSGMHETRLVSRSLDGGKTWQDVSATIPEDVGSASHPHVIDAKTYLLGTRAGANSAVLRSTDQGRTWSIVHPEGVSGPALVSRSDDHLYWLLDEGGGTITSADGGATWTEQLAWGPVGGMAGSLTELPDGRFATLGTSNVVISDDRGVSWRAIGPQLPFEPSGLTYAPSRRAFYVWHMACDKSSEHIPVPAESIMRLDVDLERL